jgi:hypothetical protein
MDYYFHDKLTNINIHFIKDYINYNKQIIVEFLYDFYTGSIAETLIYSKALSASEVAQNYYGGPVVTGSISGSYYANNLVSYVTGSTDTYNLSANIISGSLQNGVGFSPLNGGFWSFDGTDDRILLEGSTTNAWILNSGDTWTVNSWIRVPIGSSTSSGLDYQGILSNTSGGPASPCARGLFLCRSINARKFGLTANKSCTRVLDLVVVGRQFSAQTTKSTSAGHKDSKVSIMR